MENKIRVTVEYEKNETTKFDALIEQYQAAKKLADEKVAYYKPLAIAAEEGKLKAILEQVEIIKDYCRQAHKTLGMVLKPSAYVGSDLIGGLEGSHFVIYFDENHGVWSAEFRHHPFTLNNYQENPSDFVNRSYNIIAQWEKMGIFAELERQVCRSVEGAIERQNNRIKNIEGRYNSITSQ